MKSPRHILFLSALLAVASAGGSDNGTTVQTKQGPVTGTVSSGVRQFLGVPYAVANRWEAPQLPPVRNSTLHANKFGDSCPQALTPPANEYLRLTGIGDRNLSQSEDCLSVNIWTSSAQRKQKAAVMIWAHGGSIAFGTSNTPLFNGHNLVHDNEDVIVVTFNYRMNIFGQPSAPQLLNTTQTVNFGVLDSKAVVEWVYANIEAFGGDPERIVLFGQGAGGLVVDAYKFAFPNDTIVKGMIEQSGSFAGNLFVAPQSDSFVVQWNKVATAVGCGSDPTPQQLSCMKAVPSQKIEQAIIDSKLVFAAVPDGISYWKDVTNRSEAGEFLRVPILVGNTAQEGDLYIVELNDIGVGSQVPGLNTSTEEVTKIMFTCPSATTAGDHIKYGTPAWRYVYEGNFPDISSRPDLRAFHGSDIPIVFGTYKESTFHAPPTPTEIALSKYIQRAWVAFAHNPAEGLKQFGWPTYSPDTESLVLLGNSTKPDGASFTRGNVFDDNCHALEYTTPNALIAGIFTRTLGLQ